MSQFDARFERTAAQQLDSTFGDQVVYIRRGLESDPITMTWEQVEFDVSEESGFQTSVVMRDFIVAAVDLVIEGDTIEPRRGDRICMKENGKPLTFEALPVANRPHAERLAGGYRWKIHTKLVHDDC